MSKRVIVLAMLIVQGLGISALSAQEQPATQHKISTVLTDQRIEVVLSWDAQVTDMDALRRRFAPTGAPQNGSAMRLAPGGMPLMVLSFVWRSGNAAWNVAPIVAADADINRSPTLQGLKDFVDALTTAANEEFDKGLSTRRQARDVIAVECSRSEQEIEKVQEQMSSLRHKVRSVSGRVDVSPTGINKAAAGLEEEAQRIAIESTASEARKRAMEETIAKLTAQGDAKAHEDPILAELNRLVDTRVAEATRIDQMNQQKLVSKEEIETARAKVSEARIRLLERRETLATGGSMDLIKQLNRDLLTMSINLAEQQARRKVIAEMLERFTTAAQLLEQSGQLEAQVEQKMHSLHECQARLQSADRELREIRRPTVQVSGTDLSEVGKRDDKAKGK